MTAIIIISKSYDHSPAPEGNPRETTEGGRRTRVWFSTGLVGRSPGLLIHHKVPPILAFTTMLGLPSFLPPSLFSALTTYQESTLAQYFLCTKDTIIDKDRLKSGLVDGGDRRVNQQLRCGGQRGPDMVEHGGAELVNFQH